MLTMPRFLPLFRMIRKWLKICGCLAPRSGNSLNSYFGQCCFISASDVPRSRDYFKINLVESLRRTSVQEYNGLGVGGGGAGGGRGGKLRYSCWWGEGGGRGDDRLLRFKPLSATIFNCDERDGGPPPATIIKFKTPQVQTALARILHLHTT
jgi:hypothetical protein